MSLIRIANVLSLNKANYRQIICPLAKYSDSVKKDGSSSSSSSGEDSTSSSSDDERGTAKAGVSANTASSLDMKNPPKSKAKGNENLSADTKESTEPAATEPARLSQAKKVTDTVASINRLNVLLQNLKKKPESKAKTESIVPPKPAGFKKLEKKLKPEQPKTSKRISLEQATKDVATEIGGDVKKTESELVKKLLGTANQTEMSKLNLLELLTNMKVENSEPKKRDTTKRPHLYSEEQHRQRQSGQLYRKPPVRSTDSAAKRVPINLFGGQPLFIFKTDNFIDLPEPNSTWAKLYRQDLASNRMPENYFEKMAKWTEEGKVWQFPIDNEQGRDEEARSTFIDHIFLEQHLEPWCPQKGPMRNFMSLVCVGLSKNPYLTVQQKREHIEWYKNYFEEKKEVLERSILYTKPQETTEITQ